MFKFLIAAVALVASSQAFATSTYVCVGPKLSSMDTDPVTVSWNVGTASPMPSKIALGFKGALVFGSDSRATIDGFWFSSKRIWIKLSKDSKEMVILKAVSADGSGDTYKGEMILSGTKYPVTCSQRG